MQTINQKLRSMEQRIALQKLKDDVIDHYKETGEWTLPMEMRQELDRRISNNSTQYIN